MTGPLLTVVWHSRTGAAQAMAQAAAQAAGSAAQGDGLGQGDGVRQGDGAGALRVRLVAARDATAQLLLGSSGYIFVCPENLGTMSGMMKEMFDRAYYPLLGQVAGRPYATAIAAGSDGQGAQAQIERIVTGWRLRRVADPVIVQLAAQSPQAILARKTVAPAQLDRCRELGAMLAAGLSLGVF